MIPGYHNSSARRWLTAWTVALLALSWGCSGSSRSGVVKDAEGLQWPVGTPYVRLSKVIQTRRDVAGGNLLAMIGGHWDAPVFVRPYGVVWDGDDLLITDPGMGKVLRIDAGGRVSSTPQGLLTNPIGLAVCPSGIVVTDPPSGAVALLDGGLKLVRWLARDLNRPTGVACFGDSVWVAETGEHRITVIEPDGSRRHIGERGADPGQFNFPTALAAAGESLWVGDVLNFRLQWLHAGSGRSLGVFGQLGDAGGEMPRIKGVAVDTTGYIWVSDAHLDQVALYNEDGDFLMNLGGRGESPGEFAFPAGIAAHPDGRVAVADSLNRRIQIFSLVNQQETDDE